MSTSIVPSERAAVKRTLGPPSDPPEPRCSRCNRPLVLISGKVGGTYRTDLQCVHCPDFGCDGGPVEVLR